MIRGAQIASMVLVGLCGCEAVAKIDVTYVRADAAADARADATSDGGPIAPPECPCEAGTVCCFPRAPGAPTCVDAPSQCNEGLWLACTHRDPGSDSQCCWNRGTGSASATAYAAVCGDRPTVCETADDCAAGTPCVATSCGGVTIGFCGGAACP